MHLLCQKQHRYTELLCQYCFEEKERNLSKIFLKLSEPNAMEIGRNITYLENYVSVYKIIQEI